MSAEGLGSYGEDVETAVSAVELVSVERKVSPEVRALVAACDLPEIDLDDVEVGGENPLIDELLNANA